MPPPDPPFALHLPADADRLAQKYFLHQQHSQQRAKHSGDQCQLIQHGVLLLEQGHTAAHLAQPRQTKGNQEIKGKALFFFCTHTNLTAVP